MTSLLTFHSETTVSSGHTASWRSDLGPQGVTSHAQRKTRPNPGGTFQSVYFCWVFDEMALPLPGTSSGGIDYKASMNFWFRTLWEIP
jgi:hypothetical protein